MPVIQLIPVGVASPSICSDVRRSASSRRIIMRRIDKFVQRRLTRGVGLAVLATALVAVPATASVARGKPAGAIRLATASGASADVAATTQSATANVTRTGTAARTGTARMNNACRMSPLPVPAGVQYSEVAGGDHTGRYLVGGGTTFDGTQLRRVGLLWVNGKVTELNTDALAPYAEVKITDVNSHGVVIGNRITDFSTFHTDAWVYRNGRFALLPGLKPGDATNAVAINRRGDIVGTSEDYSVDPVVFHAVIWSADRPGGPRELTVGGQSPAWATGIDIDDDGTVLGQLGQRPTPEQRPFVWPARGPGYPLTGPAGTGYPSGVAIRGGWVTGEVLTADGQSVVVLWNLRSGTARVISTAHGAATAVNNKGTVATSSAIIYTDGQVQVLEGYPTVLSDRGTAAGSDGLVGTGHAVIWTGC
jgi:hypothetical protein